MDRIFCYIGPHSFATVATEGLKDDTHRQSTYTLKANESDARMPTLRSSRAYSEWSVRRALLPPRELN
jgi:hypothetical protein